MISLVQKLVRRHHGDMSYLCLRHFYISFGLERIHRRRGEVQVAGFICSPNFDSATTLEVSDLVLISPLIYTYLWSLLWLLVRLVIYRACFLVVGGFTEKTLGNGAVIQRVRFPKMIISMKKYPFYLAYGSQKPAPRKPPSTS
jgi:hypothetical protein